MEPKKKELENLSEKDFENAPITMEPDGDYQFIEIEGTFYFRNVETGEIS